MSFPPKQAWSIQASSGEAALAIDDFYATAWRGDPEPSGWLKIDLGCDTTLGGIELYWGHEYSEAYGFEHSLDGRHWSPLCQTRHGEGGQNLFAFPPVELRYLRWSDHTGTPRNRGLEIVEINLYPPEQAPSVRESGRLAVLGQAPVAVPPGESITVDLGYPRSPLGLLVEWGEPHGSDFSVHLSDDGETFREVGRITGSHGEYDNFYWRSTTSRYLRLTIHETNTGEPAVVRELKLRILNKDRMPIGQLERAAQAARGELYPQALLGRQVYWTAFGEIGHGEQALLDEYGNLEPLPGAPQLNPLLRIDRRLHGAPGATEIRQSLAEGSLPLPTLSWSALGVELEISALGHAGSAVVAYRLINRGSLRRQGALILALRPLQINPYWQHGGHATVDGIGSESDELQVNGRLYARFSTPPDAVTVAEFDRGDVIRLVESGPSASPRSLTSRSGLLSAACEFNFDLASGEQQTVVMACPMRADARPPEILDFDSIRQATLQSWREKIGPRRIVVGDPEISDTIEAQTGLILVNATPFAFKPGPRNYDRTWIRDGSSQALALLWAGLIEEAQAYVLWYAQRIYPNGLVPPILNPDGSINRGYGSDIEFDAQGEFVTIAADTYRIGRDRNFLEAVYEPVVRACRFIETLCAETRAQHPADTPFHGLLTPSISHEGYNKPTYSYWDNYFALSAWRNGEFLAAEMGDEAMVREARERGRQLAATLNRSLTLAAQASGSGRLPASADRGDVDPTSSAIAYEPCRVTDVLPEALIAPTWDGYVRHLELIREPDFKGGFTPYEIRNLNALVAQGRLQDAFQLLEDALTWRRPPGWRHWAEVVWGEPRAPDYIGDMPHTWIGAEFATAVRRMLLREQGTTLELFRAVPERWWEGEGICLNDLPTTFGVANLKAWREPSRRIVELSIKGRAPERITIRCPGVRQAMADGVPCHGEGDRVTAPHFSRLVIDL